MNRKTNRNKDAAPMPGGTSGSTPFNMARRPVPPPVPVPDIPHPLGELPPEVVGSARPRQNNRSLENFAHDDGTEPGHERPARYQEPIGGSQEECRQAITAP